MSLRRCYNPRRGTTLGLPLPPAADPASPPKELHPWRMDAVSTHAARPSLIMEWGGGCPLAGACGTKGPYRPAGRNDVPSTRLPGGARPQRCPIDAAGTTWMGHGCCSARSPHRNGGPWVRFRWSEFLVGSSAWSGRGRVPARSRPDIPAFRAFGAARRPAPGRRGHFTNVNTMAKCPRLPSKTHGTRLTPTETHQWPIHAVSTPPPSPDRDPASPETTSDTPVPPAPARPGKQTRATKSRRAPKSQHRTGQAWSAHTSIGGDEA